MDFSWIDGRTATIPDHPNVTLEFAAPEAKNDEIIDTVLGMLLQSFSKSRPAGRRTLWCEYMPYTAYQRWAR